MPGRQSLYISDADHHDINNIPFYNKEDLSPLSPILLILCRQSWHSLVIQKVRKKQRSQVAALHSNNVSVT